MTKLLDEAIAEIRKLPDADQDHAAELLLDLVRRGAGAYELTPEQVAQIEVTLRSVADGTMEYASEEEMAAVWARHGL